MRPDKLPFQATRVVKASNLLGSGEKLVWLELYGLHLGPNGAWMSGGRLGARIGLAENTVKKYRQNLVEGGLLKTHRVPGRRTSSWFTTLPQGCVPGATRPTDKAVQQYADRLDGILAQAGVFSSGGRSSERTTSPKGARTGVPESPSNGVQQGPHKGVSEYPTEVGPEVGGEEGGGTRPSGYVSNPPTSSLERSQEAGSVRTRNARPTHIREILDSLNAENGTGRQSGEQ